MGFVLGEICGTKPFVFPCKVAAADDERHLVCAVGAGWIILADVFSLLPQWNCGFKLLWLCLCMRSSKVIWNLGWYIAVEWPHECRHVVLPCASRDAGLRRDAANFL